MRKRQKVALYSVFAVSYAAAICGALRAYSSYVSFFVTYDTTWTGYDVWMWSILELHVGFICANTPALRGFCKHYFPTQRSLPSSNSRPSNLGSQGLWRRKANSRSSVGYLSEGHTSQHGAIVQMDAHYKEKWNTTQTTIQGDVSKNDIEMGRIVSFTNISVTESEKVITRPDVAAVAGWRR